MNKKRQSLFYLALSLLIMSLLVGGSILLLDASTVSDSPKAGVSSKNIDTTGALMTAGNFGDSPIYIDGNFSEGEWEGSGVVNDPYIIEDLRINPTTNGTPGILIENTDAYFKIENVTVIDSFPDELDIGGFYLDNVTNGVLINNNATENQFGFWLKNSDNNTLSNNFAKGNAVGFMLSNSANNNTLSSNIADNNNYDSPDGTLEGAGFHVEENSNDNALNNNTATNHGLWGFSFAESDDNDLINNTANNNSIGFLLAESDDNDLINNTANKNNDGSSAGFQLTGENNNLTNNIANENEGHGIYLGNSNHTTIMGNTANENKDYGIYLTLSNYNTITDNTFKYNEDGCIEEGDYFCAGNEFDNNICEDPIDSDDSNDNEIPGYNILIVLSIAAISTFLLIKQKNMTK